MVETGLDVFLRHKAGPWLGKRAGLIAHQASVDQNLQPAAEALDKLRGFRLATLFAPEHGLDGALQDQIPVERKTDPARRRPVYSLYGKNRLSPPRQALARLDCLLFDLQDIGVRYYTFIWTMVLAMKAAAAAGIPFVVLDRPNPLGGEIVEGNIPDPSFASFVGLLPIPVRHGMTCGELARYFNDKYRLGCDLTVVAMRGWKRRDWFDETGLPWVMPSPNMPTLDTATVYAGMCLLEATNLSEGRGTTRPFEVAGAPFIEAEKLRKALQKLALPGVLFRPCAFSPTFNKWAGRTCRGVQLHVTDRKKFLPYRTGLCFLQTVRRLWPGRFRWKKPPYEYETRKRPMDILCGTEGLRKAVDAGKDIRELSKAWEGPLRGFLSERKKALLY
ncbi:MAG TPA: DUF1343 domain-containing protein [Elusimicrobiota bacterium]|nr:DUF1343 domain-containing protein [Elusimicrobiota bacterium]